VRQKDGLSYGIESMLEVGSFSDAGYFAVRAIAAPQNLGKVEAAVKQELALVVKDGFTAEELENAKSGILQMRQRYREGDANIAADWVGLELPRELEDIDAQEMVRKGASRWPIADILRPVRTAKCVCMPGCCA